MVKLSQQLERVRPTRTERVEQKQIIEFEKGKRSELKSKVDKASEKLKQTSYEDYEEEYNKLDNETKQFFISPEKLKETQGYKEYLKEKEEYDQKVLEYREQQEVIEEANKEREEWEQAEKIFFKGARYDPRSSVGRKVDKLYRSREEAMKSREEANIKALEKKGITPIKKGAVVVAYKDEFGNVSYDPELKGLEVKRDPNIVYQEYLEQLPPQEKESVVEETKIEEVIDNRKWYEKSTEELVIDPIKSEAKKIGSFYWEGIKNIYKKIPSGKFYYTPKTKTLNLVGLPTGFISPFKLSDKSIDFTEKVGEAQEDLGKVRQDVLGWAVGKEKIEKLDLETKERFEKKYQTAFEEKYRKEIIYGEKTFEQASSEFEKSEKARQLQEEFTKEYGEEYKELSRDVPLSKKLIGGTAVVGLSFTQLGLSAIKTPKSAVLTAGTIYTGVGALKLIPTHVGVTTSIGLGAYGGYKAFSPTSTVEEAGGGIIMLATTGATLGYAGYKYLRSPVIKTVPIKPPKATLRTAEVIGRDVKIITDQGTTNKVIFESQKLSQVGTLGRRTVVSTKVRKYLGLEDIYKGVPYKDPKGYQKAMKKLIEYDYTPTQARATLRYTQPKIIDTYLSKGLITIRGVRSTGEFEFLTKRPIVDVDKKLGIKTRGARTIKDVYDVERKMIGDKFVFEERTKLSFVLEKGRIINLKDYDYSKAVSFGKATDLQKGYDITELKGVFREIQYKDLYSVQVSKKFLPPENIINIDASRTKLISEVIDTSTKKGFLIPSKIKKTPISKTFEVVDDVKEIIKSKPTSQVNKIIDKIDDAIPISPQEIQKLDVQQLKSVVTPNIKELTKIKDLIKIKQLDKVGYSPILSTKALLDLKTDTKLKTDLKSIINLKELIKTDIILKSQQLPKLKQAQKLKQQLRLKTDFKTPIGITLKSPTVNIPKPPVPKPPVIPIPIWLKSVIEEKQRKKRKGEFEEFALLPDFTSRAIGLDPEIITGEQAQKRIKKVLTGLEIRRGAIIQ